MRTRVNAFPIFFFLKLVFCFINLERIFCDMFCHFLKLNLFNYYAISISVSEYLKNSHNTHNTQHKNSAYVNFAY